MGKTMGNISLRIRMPFGFLYRIYSSTHIIFVFDMTSFESRHFQLSKTYFLRLCVKY